MGIFRKHCTINAALYPSFDTMWIVRSHHSLTLSLPWLSKALSGFTLRVDPRNEPYGLRKRHWLAYQVRSEDFNRSNQTGLQLESVYIETEASLRFYQNPHLALHTRASVHLPIKLFSFVEALQLTRHEAPTVFVAVDSFRYV